MNTNRRGFLQATGAGAAGLGLATLVPPAAAQTPEVTKGRRTRKMVVRADDVGHSKVCNIGTFEAIENGVVTSADVMLDSPGTADALERLKAFPWISVGWHGHMWGAPVLDPKQVPSLVEKDGPFGGRFRLDLHGAKDVVQDEAVKELRAQLDRCLRILGRVPDTGGGRRGGSPWGTAVAQVTDEYGLAYNFLSEGPTSDEYVAKIAAAQKAGEEWAQYYSTTKRPAVQADERWAGRKIRMAAGTAAYVDLLTDSISKVEKQYDPVLFYTEDRAGILKNPDDMILVQAWHPGYVDYYVYRLGERGNRARAQQFVVGRTQDVAALCDVRLKSWIKDNRIELVNLRDALYGSREYQNHLRLAGSDLYVG
jgi:predicted glycoside hydrolase/deacetylase ChbG (UPF0249 family)